MEANKTNKPILIVLLLILAGMIYNIFFGQAKIQAAYTKMEQVQTELINIKINLNQSVKQIDSVVTKLNISESNLGIIRRQVELNDIRYELSKERSRVKLDSLKKEAKKQDDELEKMQKMMSGLK